MRLQKVLFTVAVVSGQLSASGLSELDSSLSTEQEAAGAYAPVAGNFVAHGRLCRSRLARVHWGGQVFLSLYQDAVQFLDRAALKRNSVSV